MESCFGPILILLIYMQDAVILRYVQYIYCLFILHSWYVWAEHLYTETVALDYSSCNNDTNVTVVMRIIQVKEHPN